MSNNVSAFENTSDREPPTSKDIENYIQELTEIQEFLGNLDSLLSGDLIDVTQAGQILDFDEDTLSYYIAALNAKSNQLRGIKLFLKGNFNFPCSSLLQEMLDQIEPQFVETLGKLSSFKNSISTKIEKEMPQFTTGDDSQGHISAHQQDHGRQRYIRNAGYGRNAQTIPIAAETVRSMVYDMDPMTSALTTSEASRSSQLDTILCESNDHRLFGRETMFNQCGSGSISERVIVGPYLDQSSRNHRNTCIPAASNNVPNPPDLNLLYDRRPSASLNVPNPTVEISRSRFGLHRNLSGVRETRDTRAISDSRRLSRFRASNPINSASRAESFHSNEARGAYLSVSAQQTSTRSISDSEEEEDETYTMEDKVIRDTERLSLTDGKRIEFWRNSNLKHGVKRFVIDRSQNILESVIVKYQNMKTKNLGRPSMVQFIGEEGQDMGALTKEFFVLVFEAVAGGTYKGHRPMEGQRGHLIPNPMMNKRFFIFLGRIIVHAMANGCHGLAGLSPAIVHYLVNGTKITKLKESQPPLSTDDVADPELKRLLQTLEERDNLSHDEEDCLLNWMSACNCCVNWRKSRSFVIQELLFHYVFMKRIVQIEALVEGMNALGFRQFLVNNRLPENISCVFPTKEVSSTYSANLVTAVMSTRGDFYDDVVLNFFRQFMEDLHSEKIVGFSLTSLIQFVTSTPYLPDQLVVSFSPNISIPEAHACFNEIILPLNHRTYPEFMEAMITAFQNGLTGFQIG